MGIVKLKLKTKILGVKLTSKMLSAVIAALPDNTTVCGVSGEFEQMSLSFENPLFEDGAELEATFERSCAFIKGEGVEVDQFVGLNLNDCFLKDI